jgi:hypothetical protein
MLDARGVVVSFSGGEPVPEFLPGGAMEALFHQLLVVAKAGRQPGVGLAGAFP